MQLIKERLGKGSKPKKYCDQWMEWSIDLLSRNEHEGLCKDRKIHKQKVICFVVYKSDFVYICIVFSLTKLVCFSKMTLSISRKKLFGEFEGALRSTTDKKIAQHALKCIGEYNIYLEKE